MKRLSLLLIAFAFLTTASGCCCGLFNHGCCGYPSTCGYPACGACGGCGGCGYAPAYPVAPSCPSCGSCPSGGCGVQGPAVYPPTSFYDGVGSLHASAVPTPEVGGPSVASSEIATY